MAPYHGVESVKSSPSSPSPSMLPDCAGWLVGWLVGRFVAILTPKTKEQAMSERKKWFSSKADMEHILLLNCGDTTFLYYSVRKQRFLLVQE
jgi:hypothetical protein